MVSTINSRESLNIALLKQYWKTRSVSQLGWIHYQRTESIIFIATDLGLRIFLHNCHITSLPQLLQFLFLRLPQLILRSPNDPFTPSRHTPFVDNLPNQLVILVSNVQNHAIVTWLAEKRAGCGDANDNVRVVSAGESRG